MIISTIKQVQKFLLKEMEVFENPLFRLSYQMTQPGCSEKEIQQICSVLTNLPQSYLDLIKKYNFYGIGLLNFVLSPSGVRNSNMAESLVLFYKENLFLELVPFTKGLYNIGFDDTDGLFVASRQNEVFQEGEIILIEERATEDPSLEWTHLLAANFHDFILIAANAMDCQNCLNEEESNGDELREEFYRRLDTLKINPKYQKNWDYVLSIWP